MFPNFLGIGAQKAGTTWLHAMLSLHEEIWLPHLKELHYFDRKFPISQAKKTNVTRPVQGVVARHVSNRLRRFNVAKVRERLRIRRWADLAWEFRYVFGDWSDDWYASLFEEARGRLPGEITPAYSCLSETAISHIHMLMPDVKLIFLLRDPIDRAWSHAKMDLARQQTHMRNVIPDSAYMEHFSGHASRLRGDYLGTIDRWLAHFPQNQLFIGFYDDILSNPEILLLRIFQFLGVSSNERYIPCAVRKPVNVGVHVSMPPHFHRHLAMLYINDLRFLAMRYGSVPQRWLTQAESVLKNTQGRREH